MRGIFAETAPAYFEAGLPVIPLYTKEKRPIPMDWSRFHDQPVEPGVIEEWLATCSEGNIGLVLGEQSGICVLDIDSEDAKIVALIQQLVPVSPWRRVGAKGVVLAFRWSGLKTFRIKTAKGESICELLSDRTQVVLPPLIHPKTERPYTANCELLSVLDQLPTLDPQIEAILRGAFKEQGVDLSLSGHTRVTDYVSSGSRDTSLTEKAGLFAFAVMRGERSLKEAVGMLRSYNTEFVEQVASDGIDVEKHVSNLIRFLHRDVIEKQKNLPQGWDEGLSDEEKAEFGLSFDKDHVEWSAEEMRDYLQEQFETHASGSSARYAAVEKVLARLARSTNLTVLEQGRVVEYITSVSGLGLKASTLRNRIKEIQQSGIAGTDHSEIARAVLGDLEQINIVRRHGAGMWRYGGSHWEPLADQPIMAAIATDYGSLAAGKRHSDHKGILATLRNITTVGIKALDVKGINFANGFLDEQLVLRDHSPDYGMTYTLPFRYVPNQAGNAPHFNSFLADCWGPDEDFELKKDALQEALCVTLFGLGPLFQRVVLLKGVAKSGKSQLLKIAQSLVPDDAKCFVPPNDWGDKFLPTRLHDKLINICGELSEKKKIDGQRFKDIVDGGEMSGQLKGGQIFNFRPVCTHWFASNHTPKTDDTSDGFNRRWLMLEFNYPVAPEKRQLDIGDLIVAEEREAIVAWAVQALPRLQEQKEYTLPPSHLQMIREVAQENNSVRFFMEESRTVRVVQDSSKKVDADRLYKEYWSFSYGPGGVKPVGAKVFRHAMKALESDLKFKCHVSTNQMGNQDVDYQCVTLVNEPTT